MIRNCFLLCLKEKNIYIVHKLRVIKQIYDKYKSEHFELKILHGRLVFLQ